MRIIILFSFLFLLICKSVFAANFCSDEHSDAAVYQCTLQQKKTAEEELNREYTAAKKRISLSYAADQEMARDYLSILTNTQRGWLKYRDGQCKLEAFVAEESSNAHEVATNLCIIRIDKERIESLLNVPY